MRTLDLDENVGVGGGELEPAVVGKLDGDQRDGQSLAKGAIVGEAGVSAGAVEVAGDAPERR